MILESKKDILDIQYVNFLFALLIYI